MYGFRLLFCSSPGILRQPQHLARERETFWYHFCPCTPYGSRVSLIGEEEEEEERKKERKDVDDFRFFQNSASIKLSGNQRTYLYSGRSGLSIDIHFVDIELSYDVLSPLPTNTYIEIATAIYPYHQAIAHASNVSGVDAPPTTCMRSPKRKGLRNRCFATATDINGCSVARSIEVTMVGTARSIEITKVIYHGGSSPEY